MLCNGVITNRKINTRVWLVPLTKAKRLFFFSPDGNIVKANENFLSAMGYSESEIEGKHHSLFVTREYASSQEYKDFWSVLQSGEAHSGEFCRLNNKGEDVWIQASYNPIFDHNGKVTAIVKFAIDITAEKKQNADYKGQIDAISKSQAVIEFDLQGNILTANDNFLSVMGYSLEEVKGKHHSTFVEREVKLSPEYAAFWKDLQAGNYRTGEFKRLGKGGE